jgi:hypothetical protein
VESRPSALPGRRSIAAATALPRPTSQVRTCGGGAGLHETARVPCARQGGREVLAGAPRLESKQASNQRGHRSAPATKVPTYLDAVRCRGARGNNTTNNMLCMASACTTARLAAPPVVVSWARSARAAASEEPPRHPRRLFGEEDGRRWWPEPTSSTVRAQGRGPVVGAQGAREVSIHIYARTRTLPCVLCFACLAAPV